jgi:hypothetical protein
MLKETAKIGMRVVFGRPNGEKTLGEITKINTQKAKVKILEERGSKGYAGQVWGVPYSMMEPEKNTPTTTTPYHTPAPKTKFTYNPFDQDNDLYESLSNVYNGLSPENLTCDGELPQHQVQQRYRELNRKLKGLQIALGRTFTEDDMIDWYLSKIEYQKKQKQAQ